MNIAIGERLRTVLAPPRYIALPFAGIDISSSGVKAVRLEETTNGFILTNYSQARFPAGAYVEGDIVDHEAVVDSVKSACKIADVNAANATLPESKSYLFETDVDGNKKSQWRTIVEQRIDEFVPLPPLETIFDVVEIGKNKSGNSRLAGVGFARRIVDDTLSVFDDAGISIRALEGEMFAISRALLPPMDESITLIVDIGKSTTKISIVEKRIPRFATTVGIGGHSLTLAVQKHFGVTEKEARKVKAEKGIVPAPGNEDYLGAMLSSVSAIKDEISRPLEFWQQRAASGGIHRPIDKAILAGGNASVRGLAEYLEGAFKIPVETGDVFTNLASRDYWLPELDYTESLAFATAIGLALYDVEQSYA